MQVNIRDKTKIAVISNVTIEPYFSEGVKTLLEDAQVSVVAYDECIYGMKQIINSDLILIWLNFEIMFPNYIVDILSGELTLDTFIRSVKAIYDDMLNKILILNGKRVLIMTHDTISKIVVVRGNVVDKDDYSLKLNEELIVNYSKVATLIDINRLIANEGIKSAYDFVNKYRWNAVYSSGFIKSVANEVYKQFLIYRGVTKKCIVLDCDNVLWGGIISEDGIGKIDISNMGEGLFFQDFQRFILELYYGGVILAIASKNNYDDIINIFDNHSGMILKKEHISCFEVNWNKKSDSILKIAKFLNIGLDSIVFVDDSQYEIELVKMSLPEVTTIFFNKNVDFYSQFSCINLNKAIDHAVVKLRNETYKTNQERELLRQNSVNFQDFLNSLATKIEIHKATEFELKRISELSLRANRCTNGVRYTVEQIANEFNVNGENSYSVYVEDRFGDLGLVGAIIISGDTINLFCLSCRALGRDVEDKMVRFILDEYNVKKIYFIDTYKNGEIKRYLSSFFDCTVM